ncbi:hypothetical protein TREMEDRAFT_70076 [Tremella mesenterica DSM 1558]|uniref:uncharacterized protein n=1 Tax=Tremella mesenterica (strain ATCC 24925 / CBS 8224 / DSM 1558 / NBRC 9311 / NRRL Y-6157 / RJB 2259-6 / UBC 559-6) TaxID=578456 RepID=UPI00032D4F5B|nr:uncharacterized protein TREMEDRAFT_70076 [Tremella mesenterica DSM 1558]EIW66455.1 hypothetical protein TREMEDRAFT_70076 [Tremella mesenterica DSM 1558]
MTLAMGKSGAGGDDLDDQFELDPELVASSEAESNVDPDEYLEPPSPRPVPKSTLGKRKESEGRELDQDKDEVDKQKEKRKRKREKDKIRRAKRIHTGVTTITSDVSPADYTPEILSTLFTSSLKASLPQASELELTDLYLPLNIFLLPLSTHSKDLSNPPTKKQDDSKGRINNDQSQTSSESFISLQKQLSLLSLSPTTFGSPNIIILCLSGLRCVDVVRAVKPYRGNGEVAKLFAKHMKFSAQEEYLKKTKVSVAVGTPARVGKLIESGALRLSEGSVILLDLGHEDSKKRTLITLPEVRDELWKTFFNGKCRQMILANAKIGAF